MQVTTDKSRTQRLRQESRQDSWCSSGRMASLRVRQRKDGTAYTSVLYVHDGRQTSSSFNDHAEALRFQDVCNRLGPAEALKVWKATTPQRGARTCVATLLAMRFSLLS